MKREHSAAGEGLAPKRQRILRTASTEKLTDSQIQDLLHRIVQSTEDWTTQHLESLYASLELTLEKTEDDVYTAMNECFEVFHECDKFVEQIKKNEAQNLDF